MRLDQERRPAGTDEPAPPIRVRPRVVVDWIVANPLPALTIVGVLLYGVLRLAYLFFYLRLRTNPEEVGYGYSQILAQSIVGAVELVLVVFLLIAPVAAAGYGLLRLLTRHPRKGTRPQGGPQSGNAGRRGLHRVVIRSLLAALLIVVVGLPIAAWWQGGLAQKGQTIRNVYFVGIPYIPVLAVQAVPASASWVGGESQGQFNLSGRNCLMYLGKADGIAVFFDVRSRESVRLPASDIVVSLKYTFFVDQSCR